MATQKTYGLPPEAIRLREQTFREDLASYSAEQIANGFTMHRKCSNELPSVHDILKHMDPGAAGIQTPLDYEAIIDRAMRKYE